MMRRERTKLKEKITSTFELIASLITILFGYALIWWLIIEIFISWLN